ncbi:MAG TPA: MipA/OmpV family protein [Dokdonella sp.]|uniref:MipA/OmpV family protein n=1 Tax=Dokdonella sp. TaxID=2291710 RepID=UPI002CFC3625|nr:MipA/OmpV family protein [Dokdonella sp.]HUD40902.1 MipA/OmpV family protein [Dokdonella sp.]
MLKSCFSAAVLLASPFASAQSGGVTEEPIVERVADEAPHRWTVGLALSISDSAYAGEDTRLRPFPLITFEGERFFWRGLGGGFHLFERGGFTLDAVASGRFDGFDIDDLGRRELAANGVDARLLEDRDDGLDVGIAATWSGRAGEFKLRALADATDTSGGYEIAADYGYPVHLGRATVVPAVGLRWMSKDLANYYYGTLDEEVARGVARYRPGSVLVPQVGVGFLRPLGAKWSLFGSIDYKFLPDELTDSPLLDPDASGSAGFRIGFSRSF